MGKTEQMRLAPQTPSYSGLAVTFGATIFEHKGQRYRHRTLQVMLLNPFLWGSSPAGLAGQVDAGETDTFS